MNTTCIRTCLLVILAACSRRTCPTIFLSDMIQIRNGLKTYGIFSYDNVNNVITDIIVFKILYNYVNLPFIRLYLLALVTIT